ncbi:MAG: hypothetical protein IJ813_02865 [Bacteroidales bacterium]|nr:hypothetical protein [Bacteroidales bacterium]
MEHHIHIVADGKSVRVDGIPEYCGPFKLPENIVRGIEMIWALVESRVRTATCICIGAIGYTGDPPAVCAFDIWVQAGEEGCFLPMDTAAKLFCQNGIPYFHSPLMS